MAELAQVLKAHHLSFLQLLLLAVALAALTQAAVQAVQAAVLPILVQQAQAIHHRPRHLKATMAALVRRMRIITQAAAVVVLEQ